MEKVRKSFETKSGFKGAITVKKENKISNAFKRAALFVEGSLIIGLLSLGITKVAVNYMSPREKIISSASTVENKMPEVKTVEKASDKQRNMKNDEASKKVALEEEVKNFLSKTKYTYIIDNKYKSAYIILPSNEDPSAVVKELAKDPSKCFFRLAEDKDLFGKTFPINNEEVISAEEKSYVIEIPFDNVKLP